MVLVYKTTRLCSFAITMCFIEKRAGQRDIIACDSDGETLEVHEPKVKLDLTPYTEQHAYQFDGVFASNNNNRQV
jgi:hypothetical protein